MTTPPNAPNHEGLCKAASNGRLCFETGRPMKDSNPYRRGTKSHAAFEAAYSEAEARAALSGRVEG